MAKQNQVVKNIIINGQASKEVYFGANKQNRRNGIGPKRQKGNSKVPSVYEDLNNSEEVYQPVAQNKKWSSVRGN